MAGKRITDLPETTITQDTMIEVAQNGASGSASLGQIIGRFITITSDYMAIAGDRVGVDTSAGPININLPSSASDGDKIGFYDPHSTWTTNNASISGDNIVTKTNSNITTLICTGNAPLHFTRLGSMWLVEDGIE